MALRVRLGASSTRDELKEVDVSAMNWRWYVASLVCLTLACGKDDNPADGSEDQGVGADQGMTLDMSSTSQDQGASPQDGGTRPADQGGPQDMAQDEDLGEDMSAPQDMTVPPPTGRCAPLPAASGEVIMVTPAQADDLPDIVARAASGATILLADGTYRSSRDGEGSRRLNFRTPGVTLRSASGNAGAVIIDGEYKTKEIINISADDVTIAEVTIMHAEDHLIHATGNGAEHIVGVKLHGLRLWDAGEQFIKVNGSGQGGFVDDGELTCSFFELTDAGRPNIERAGGGCYTGGIDTHSAQGWHVADNHFKDIYCAGEGLAEHAVHFWRNSRDTVVERNIIENCARGIGFGLNPALDRRSYDDNPYPGVGLIEHIDGVIQNNMIFADIPFYDTGIELQHARGTRVDHNTVMSTPSATGFFSSIDYRFEVTQVTLRNNIARRITSRNGGNATLGSNIEAPDASLFVDLASGDLHLAASASQAIDKATTIQDVTDDFEGDPRQGARDIGADERE